MQLSQDKADRRGDSVYLMLIMRTLASQHAGTPHMSILDDWHRSASERNTYKALFRLQAIKLHAPPETTIDKV